MYTRVVCLSVIRQVTNLQVLISDIYAEISWVTRNKQNDDKIFILLGS